MDTFTPPRPPDIDASGESEFRVLSAQFGDGYSQRAADGMNNEAETFNLVWSVLSKAEHSALVAFLRLQGGYKAFLWESPLDSGQKKWTCKGFSSGFPGNEMRSLSAKFERVYDL